MIGVFAGGDDRRAAAEVAGRFGARAAIVDGPVASALPRVWHGLEAAVLFAPTDSVVRVIAPLLRDASTDPAVVCVDEHERFAVAVVGAAGGRTNALAVAVADVLGCEPVITATAGAAGTVVDDVVEAARAVVDGDLSGCASAVVGGEPVRLVNPLGFALPPLPASTSAAIENAAWTLVIDDRRPGEHDDPYTVRLIPRTIVVGIGARGDVSRTDVAETMALLDTEYGIDPRAVRACATVDAKSGAPAIVDAVQDLGFWNSPDGDELPLLSYPPETLDAVPVPNPSELVRSESGSSGVAEAAALHAAGTMGRAELAVTKTKGRGVTVAAARVLPRGRLAVIDIGPGEHEQRTPRADAELRRASVLVGTRCDLDSIRHVLRPGTEVITPAPASPADGLDAALERARAGCAVAVIGSTGSGVADVATGAPDLARTGVEVVVVPGAGTVGVWPG